MPAATNDVKGGAFLRSLLIVVRDTIVFVLVYLYLEWTGYAWLAGLVLGITACAFLAVLGFALAQRRLDDKHYQEALKRHNHVFHE